MSTANNPEFLDPSNIATVGGTTSTPYSQVSVNQNATNPWDLGVQSPISWGTLVNTSNNAVSPQSGTTAGGSKLISDISSLNSVNSLVKSLSTTGTASATVGTATNTLGIGNISQGGAFNDAVANGFGSGTASADALDGTALSQTNLASDIGSVGSTATSGIGSFLGAAGTGFAEGGFLARLLGENKLGGSIGGALGGVAGSVLLGGVTTGLGAALGGTALGAEIGSIIPGVGTIIGAAAGSLLGGLFGGGKANPAVKYQDATLNPDGTLGKYTASGEHVNVNADAASLANPLQSYLQNQAKTYGIKYGNGITVNGYYDVNGSWGKGYYPSVGLTDSTQSSNKNAITVATGTGTNSKIQAFYYNTTDPASQQTAYQNAFNYVAQQSGYDPAQLKAVNSTANTVTIPSQNNPTAWQNFLTNYRQQNPTSTPQPTQAT